jgi:hypothetical protein
MTGVPRSCSICGGTYSFAEMAIIHSNDCQFNPKNANAYIGQAPEPKPEEGNVLQLHKSFAAREICDTLRRIAGEIENGKYGLVTTAVVCIGHASEKAPDQDHIIEMSCTYNLFAAGPRVDLFTVRGLLQTCLNKA